MTITIIGGNSAEDKQVLIDNTEEEDESPRENETDGINGNARASIITLGVQSFQQQTDFFHEINDTSDIPTFCPCSTPIPSTHQQQEKRKWKKWLLSRIRRLTRPFLGSVEILRFHWKLIVSSVLVILGSAGCLICFPVHLENVSRGDVEVGDGYTACLAACTITTVMLLFTCIILEIIEKGRGMRRGDSVLRPLIGWQNAMKVGFCMGLSLVTTFYAWEDMKVPCNFQDPLLGLVIIFAIITHAVCKWQSIGLKRIFALATVSAGVFLSVDYPLVDHHRCRGYYYRNTVNEDEGEERLDWTWKVNLVWTMSFIISIWLGVVACFFLENSIPVPKIKHSRLYDLEYNAVKLRVMSQSNNDEGETGNAQQPPNPNNVDSQNIYARTRIYRCSPYSSFHFSLTANAVLWFAVATLAVVISLFWTEFIPGFGKGIAIEKLPSRSISAFRTSLTTPTSWALFISIYLFAQAFTYLTVLTRSPITAISVSTIGFPIIGLWWSFFHIKYGYFQWMPVFSGELICSGMGLITVLVGVYYFIKFEILRPARSL